ncbi:MAG: 4Fe-4S binding protein [Treponema sp.]|nr:4Fe-4S binding protein [Treponema sp.]
MAYNINENCTGCTACAKLCPVFAITRKEGPGEKNTRYIINEKRCVDCGVCGRICQKEAISDSAGKICVPVKRAQWQKPAIDAAVCSACSICVNDCTSGALAISPPEFRGDINVFAQLSNPQKCTGCAICRSHCPISAIVMKDAS